MAVTFRLQWPVFLLFYYLLASTATAPRRNDRKNTNRYRKTTTSTEHILELDLESSTTFKLTAISTLTTISTTPTPLVVFTVPENDDMTRPVKRGNVTRKTTHTKPKLRRNSTQAVNPITINTVYSNITSSSLVVSPHVTTDHTISSTLSPRLPEIATPNAVGLENTTGMKAIIPQGGETEGSRLRTVHAHQKHPRHKSTSFTSASTTQTTPSTTSIKSTFQTMKDYRHTTLDGHKVRPFSSKFIKYGSEVSYVKEIGSTCNKSCELLHCEPVEAEMCNGRVVKDQCNCCPVCLGEQTTNDPKAEVDTKRTSYHPNNACDGMVCTKNKVCILNIQGIPMCRCTNIYSCRNFEKNLLCAQNGVTYKNKCYLRAEECATGRRVRISHKGACRSSPLTTDSNAAQNMDWVPRSQVNGDTYSDTRMFETTHRKGGKHAMDQWKHTTEREKATFDEHRPRKRFGYR